MIDIHNGMVSTFGESFDLAGITLSVPKVNPHGIQEVINQCGYEALEISPP